MRQSLRRLVHAQGVADEVHEVVFHRIVRPRRCVRTIARPQLGHHAIQLLVLGHLVEAPLSRAIELRHVIHVELGQLGWHRVAMYHQLVQRRRGIFGRGGGAKEEGVLGLGALAAPDVLHDA
eukprot:6311044-Prymnesium_polylepis.1